MMERQRIQMDVGCEDVEVLVGQFDNGFEGYYGQKEDELRKLVEQMNDEMVGLIDRWKQKQNGRSQQDDNGQIMTTINDIKQQYEQIINQLEEMIKQQHDTQNWMMMKYDDTIRHIKQLQKYTNYVNIFDYDRLDIYKKEIEQYQRDGKQYRININFGYVCFRSINSKIELLTMINRLNADSNVGELSIQIKSDNQWNEEILAKIGNNYNNVYSIAINDSEYSFDDIDSDSIYKMIRQLIQQQPIVEFRLWFHGCLYDDYDSYDLIKGFNKLIKQKQYFEYLEYYHAGLGGKKYAESRQEIKQLIEIVDNHDYEYLL